MGRLKGWSRYRLATERLAFLQTLAALSTVKEPLPEILQACGEGSRDHGFRRLVEQVAGEVKQGRTLTSALQAAPDLMPPAALALIRAGENTGTLGTAATAAAAWMEQRFQARNDLTAALIYPMTVMVLSFAAILFLASSILPKMQQMYVSAGAKLPLLTRMVMSGGKILAAAGVLLVLAAIVWRFSALGQRLATSRSALWIIGLLRFVPLERVRQSYHLAVWPGMLGVLINHGIPLPEALSDVADTLTDPVDIFMLKRVKLRLEEGLPPAACFSAEPGLPHVAQRLIAAGDRSGKLGDALNAIAGYYRRRYDTHSRTLIALAEPAAIVAAGAVILLIALAVMLPIADLGGIQP